MIQMKKQVLILIGLKGSGKTYIGSLLQEKFDIKFFRVEEIWLSLKSEKLTNEYIKEGFSKVEKEIDKILHDTDRIIIESTGTTDYFRIFLDRLKTKYELKLIKVQTSPELCLIRVKSRNSVLHVPVSDEIVDIINQEALNLDMQYDLIIDNEKSTDREILENIQKFFKSKISKL
jgi:shikimate kinase